MYDAVCVRCFAVDTQTHAGYFKPTSSSSSWSGSISQLQLGDHYPPDAGPHTATAAAGVVTVGAVPWVTNFNIPLYTQDMAAAKAVARALSTKGGGLPGVEVGRGRCEVRVLCQKRKSSWLAGCHGLHETTQHVGDTGLMTCVCCLCFAAHRRWRCRTALV